MTVVVLTVIAGIFGLVFALVRPQLGLALALITLYYPLIPNVQVGPLEFSFSTFILIGLFLATFDLPRRGYFTSLLGWQRWILFALGFSFFLSYLFSDSPSASLHYLPNLVTYLLWLYVMMKWVKSEKQLWDLARLILVLAGLLSIWRVELRPLRILLGLPSMGINGAVFVFHPAMAVSLVTVTMLAKNRSVTRGWRTFAWLVLFSMVYHGFLFETRSAWLAWMSLAVVFGLQAPNRARIALILAGTALAGITFLLFADRIEANLIQTRQSVQIALSEEGDTADYYALQINSDDLIRLVARDAGLRMFRQRPLLGWGPDAYIRLKSLFVNFSGKEARLPGAFNSWLIVLTEYGLVGIVIMLFVFMFPIFQTWRYRKQPHTLTNRLALAFAMGVLALSVHLLFIDLLYSFVWAHVGLALAATRLTLEEVQAGHT